MGQCCIPVTIVAASHAQDRHAALRMSARDAFRAGRHGSCSIVSKRSSEWVWRRDHLEGAVAMQEFEFIDNRKVFRFVGILLLGFALLATYVIYSAATGRTPDLGRPDIHMPLIGALPPGAEGAPSNQR
jgi:hypothetical protein